MRRDADTRLVGIQCLPFDVIDEGAEHVVDNCATRLGASVILPAVTYVSERHPYPTGVLPHNPVRTVYQTDGGAYFRPQLELYGATRIRPSVTREPGILDSDWLPRLVEQAKARGIDVYAWVSVLCGTVADADQDARVVDALGRTVPGWLCPNSPGVVGYATALIRDIVRNLPCDGLFIDRIRFPEWGGRGKGLGAAFTCFCSHCMRRAAGRGVELASVREALASRLAAAAGRPGPRTLTPPGRRTSVASVVDVLKRGELLEAVVSLVRARQDAICDLVSEVYGAAKAERPEMPVWLDLWPPSYGWLLGQDFSRLGSYADAVKVFTYHKLGGGIDVATVLEEFQASLPFLSQEDLYALFLDVFRFPAPPRLDGFRVSGFHTDFITAEMTRAVNELKDETPLLAGLQIWNVSAAEIDEAVRAALAARPRGVIFYNYGWATLENMERAREVIRTSCSGVTRSGCPGSQ